MVGEGKTCRELEDTHVWLLGSRPERPLGNFSQVNFKRFQRLYLEDINFSKVSFRKELNLGFSDHWQHPRLPFLVLVSSNCQVDLHLERPGCQSLILSFTLLSSLSCLAFMCSTSMGGPSLTPEKRDMSAATWGCRLRFVFCTGTHSSTGWRQTGSCNVHHVRQPVLGICRIC